MGAKKFIDQLYDRLRVLNDRRAQFSDGGDPTKRFELDKEIFLTKENLRRAEKAATENMPVEEGIVTRHDRLKKEYSDTGKKLRDKGLWSATGATAGLAATQSNEAEAGWLSDLGTKAGKAVKKFSDEYVEGIGDRAKEYKDEVTDLASKLKDPESRGQMVDTVRKKTMGYTPEELAQMRLYSRRIESHRIEMSKLNQELEKTYHQPGQDPRILQQQQREITKELNQLKEALKLDESKLKRITGGLAGVTAGASAIGTDEAQASKIDNIKGTILQAKKQATNTLSQVPEEMRTKKLKLTSDDPAMALEVERTIDQLNKKQRTGKLDPLDQIMYGMMLETLAEFVDAKGLEDYEKINEENKKREKQERNERILRIFEDAPGHIGNALAGTGEVILGGINDMGNYLLDPEMTGEETNAYDDTMEGLKKATGYGMGMLTAAGTVPYAATRYLMDEEKRPPQEYMNMAITPIEDNYEATILGLGGNPEYEPQTTEGRLRYGGIAELLF